MATVADVSEVFQELAPLHLAQEWDNVGLLVGDTAAPCKSILLTIDLTEPVLAEAVAAKCDMVMAYHPPLFKPISALRARSSETDAVIWRAVRNGVSIYSMHTALDAAEGGTNDVLAQMCGALDLEPFEYVDAPASECKVVVFVPVQNVDQVADAMSAAGAGRIGDYEKCSFRIPGSGTFQGSDTTKPTVGDAGQFETVEELRLEMVAPTSKLPEVVEAIRQSHPYEEPAFDIYPLRAKPVAGIGRIGRLAAPIALADLVKSLTKLVPTQLPAIVGEPAASIERVAVCVGAAGDLPLRLGLGPGDCVVTGEMRHHDALALERRRIGAIVLGHWASERPVLASLAERLAGRLDGVTIRVSRSDRDPLRKP